ncbi:MAG: T9SS type A sorting domain-containing protein, partial [Bacteroidota bacterium]
CQNTIPYDIRTAWVAENAELLFNGGYNNSNVPKIVYVVDSNFTMQDSVYIPNGDLIDLTFKAMDDGGIYFLDNFSNNITIQNNSYPNLPVINLNNAGSSDIFLGRYHRRGYMPLAFNNFDSTIKFCSGNFQINLQDSNVLHYRGKGNVHYRWEPAANFQNPDTLNTTVTMIADTLTARLIATDGVDTITKTIFFRTGIESGLRLNLSDTVACGNGILYASLTGSLFDTCIVKSLCTGNTWRFESLIQVNDIYFYNSPPGCDSFQTFRLEMLENSNYCSDTSTFTVKIKPYYIAPVSNIYVCPGSSYTIPGDTTYTNITGRIWRVKKFINQFGCDSVITTDINVLPYTAGETAYVCEGGSYTFPDGTTLNNIAFQPSGGSPEGIPYLRTRTIASVYGCDSIYITTNLYVKRTSSRTNRVSLCPGTDYTFADGTIFSNILADTSHTIHFTNINGCDSVVTTAIHTLTGTQNNYVSICKGGSYVFPDGTTFTNIVSDTSHTSRFFAINNCDSFIVTNITVLPTYNYIQNDTVCKGGNYTFPGGLQVFNIISDLSQTTHLITFSGCDSNIVTNITVLPTYSFTQNDTVCNGANYIFPDNVLAENITSDLSHTSHLVTSSGCDSIIVTNITVLPSYSFTENDTVCKGDNYIFPDNVQATNIISNVSHTSYFATSSGCDSIIVTNITVISNDTSVIKNRATLTANLNNAQYQWIDCSSDTPILSETNQAYTATLVGRYAVQLIKDGCIDTSACYDISFEDLLRRANNNNVSVSPNPASNIISLQYLSPSASQINISISDLFGQRVQEESRLVMAGINSFEINIASLSRGVYLLVLYDQAVNNRIVKRIVKN